MLIQYETLSWVADPFTRCSQRCFLCYWPGCLPCVCVCVAFKQYACMCMWVCVNKTPPLIALVDLSFWLSFFRPDSSLSRLIGSLIMLQAQTCTWSICIITLYVQLPLFSLTRYKFIILTLFFSLSLPFCVYLLLYLSVSPLPSTRRLLFAFGSLSLITP